MLSIVLCLFGGHCVQPVVQKQYYAQQVIAAQVVPLYVAQPINAGYDAERIRQLENAVQQLTVIAQQQQQLIQMNGPLGLQSSESRASIRSREIINTKCLSCHKGETAKAGFDLSGELTVGEKLLIAESVAGDEMPPKNPLSNEDKQTLFEWSREDKAAVREYLRAK